MKPSQISTPATQPLTLRGWITATYTTYNGKKLGPYYSRTWKVAGKIKREYIKPADLERIRAACHAYREKRKRQSTNTQNLKVLLGNLNYLRRICKREQRGRVRPEDLAFVAQLEQTGYFTPGRPSLKTQSCFANLRSKVGNRQSNLFMYPSAENSNQNFALPPASRRSPIPSAILRAKSETPPQHPTPNTQHLTPNTQLQNNTRLKRLKQILDRPNREKLNAETLNDKWSRWLKKRRELPTPEPNLKRALPEWLPPEKLKETVAEISALVARPRPTAHPHPRTLLDKPVRVENPDASSTPEIERTQTDDEQRASDHWSIDHTSRDSSPAPHGRQCPAPPTRDDYNPPQQRLDHFSPPSFTSQSSSAARQQRTAESCLRAEAATKASEHRAFNEELRRFKENQR